MLPREERGSNRLLLEFRTRKKKTTPGKFKCRNREKKTSDFVVVPLFIFDEDDIKEAENRFQVALGNI